MLTAQQAKRKSLVRVFIYVCAVIELDADIGNVTKEYFPELPDEITEVLARCFGYDVYTRRCIDAGENETIVDWTNAGPKHRPIVQKLEEVKEPKTGRKSTKYSKRTFEPCDEVPLTQEEIESILREEIYFGA